MGKVERVFGKGIKAMVRVEVFEVGVTSVRLERAHALYGGEQTHIVYAEVIVEEPPGGRLSGRRLEQDAMY